MSRRLRNACLIVALASSSVAADTIDRVVVRPPYRITTDDSVTLEILVLTNSSKARRYEPTQVTMVGNEIFVDVYIKGGPTDFWDSWLERVELGILPPGTYEYTIVQHLWLQPYTDAATGGFCVTDADCGDASCRCPSIYPTYTIIELPASYVQAINDRGQVIGTFEGHRQIWDSGELTNLAGIWPYDINNVGHVAGNFLDPSGGTFASVWLGSYYLALGHLSVNQSGGGDSKATAINEHDWIAGYSRSSWPGGAYRAVLWRNGGLVALPDILGGIASKAWDINAVGQIVGSAGTQSGVHAVLWENGGVTDLGTLGGRTAEAYGINDSGQVVGESTLVGGSSFRAFLWDNGGMIDLGTLRGFSGGTALAINNDCQIIGVPGFLYEPGKGMSDLRDLIDVDAGWPSLSPLDINNSGQIIGYVNPRTFLMTPIDADLDDDGDTNLADYSILQRCFSGSGVSIGPQCEASDIDRDADVDLFDFRAFGWATGRP